MISPTILLNHALIEYSRSYDKELRHKVIPKVPVFKFYSTIHNKWVLVHASQVHNIFALQELEDKYFVCYWDADRWVYLHPNNYFMRGAEYEEKGLLECIEIIKPDFSKTVRECRNTEQLNNEYFGNK